MEAWIGESFADEGERSWTAGKSIILRGSATEMKAIASFMNEVVRHLDRAGFCHMHLRDSMSGWSKAEHVDFEVTVDVGAG